MMQVEIPVYKLRQGKSPLMVSMPHTGSWLPQWLQPRLTEEALALADTDWHLEQLYDFLDALDATVLVATHSRYVIDLNRPPDTASLYPGQSTTSLCPLDSFSDRPLYLPGKTPDTAEAAARIEQYWRPYHDTLSRELVRLKTLHQSVVLWDAHSIRSVVPRFFEGELPQLNIGTADDQSCHPALTVVLAQIAAASSYSGVANGRFKGGYITRRYGAPGQGVHAVQLEIAMRSYMKESAPYVLDEARTADLRPVLRKMMQAAVDWAV